MNHPDAETQRERGSNHSDSSVEIAFGDGVEAQRDFDPADGEPLATSMDNEASDAKTTDCMSGDFGAADLHSSILRSTIPTGVGSIRDAKAAIAAAAAAAASSGASQPFVSQVPGAKSVVPSSPLPSPVTSASDAASTHDTLPTLATARVVEQDASGMDRNVALDEERERFRQQVREAIAAEAVHAEPIEAPTLEETKAGCQTYYLGILAIVLLLVTIITGTILGLQRQNRSSQGNESINQPTFAPMTDAPAVTEAPIVYLPDGRQAFTATTQLYTAVDAYLKALDSIDTAEGSDIAIQYGYPMGRWDVSRLTDFSRVFMVDRAQRVEFDTRFSQQSLFNEDLSGWDLSNATTVSAMFAGAVDFVGNGLDQWDVSQVSDFSFMFFQCTAFAGNVSAWNTSSATAMTAMFMDAESFDGDLSQWDVSQLRIASRMMSGAIKFTGGDLSRWNVSQVTDMSSMFSKAGLFDGNISTWDTSNVEQMQYMFQSNLEFNGDVSAWSVGKVTSMDAMFTDATKFVGGNLSRWNTSRVTQMYATFFRSESFNADLSLWDVSRVLTFEGAFEWCYAFNGDLSAWDTSSAVTMESMFKDAWLFAGNISSWNTSRVTNMVEMFHNTEAFNGNVSTWDVSSVSDASGMFKELEVFNQSLCAWSEKLPPNAAVTDMFIRSGCIDQSDPVMTDASFGPFCWPCDGGVKEV